MHLNVSSRYSPQSILRDINVLGRCPWRLLMKGMKKPDSTAALQNVDGPVNPRSIPKSQFMNARTDAGHWPGQRKRKHLTSLEPRDSVRKVSTYFLRPFR